jgi:hypothetical protein
VEIAFDVDGTSATFRRDAWLGRADLDFADATVCLQSPTRFSTHFSRETTRSWRERVGAHDVEIVMERPRVFGGFRRKRFTVRVDGSVVAQAIGI